MNHQRQPTLCTTVAVITAPQNPPKSSLLRSVLTSEKPPDCPLDKVKTKKTYSHNSSDKLSDCRTNKAESEKTARSFLRAVYASNSPVPALLCYALFATSTPGCFFFYR